MAEIERWFGVMALGTAAAMGACGEHGGRARGADAADAHADRSLDAAMDASGSDDGGIVGMGGGTARDGAADALEASIDADTGAAPDASADADSGADAAPDGPSHPPLDATPPADAGPPTRTLFSVSPATVGRPASAVAASTVDGGRAGGVFGAPSPTECWNCHAPSEAPGPPAAGNNTLVVAHDALGLGSGDDVDALAVPTGTTGSAPALFFSVTEGTTGRANTALERSRAEDGAAADVFFSDGTGTSADANAGYNGVYATRIQLGLAGGTPDGGGQQEDVDALEILAEGAPAFVHFSVRPGAVGGPGSAVSSTPAAERGCTIYSSTLDGTHRVAWSCADLGLTAGDDVDALAVIEDGGAPEIWLSVAPGSLGLPGTGVANQRPPQGAVFRSAGDRLNALVASSGSLGLLDTGADVDALAVGPLEAPPALEWTRSCILSRTFAQAAPPFFALAAPDLLVAAHLDASSTLSLTAFDTSSACTSTAETSTAGVTADRLLGLAVRLVDFPVDPAAPFSALEHWVLVERSGSVYLARWDSATGSQGHRIEGLAPDEVRSFVYSFASDAFGIARGSASGHTLTLVDRPATGPGTITVGEQRGSPIPAPCSVNPIFAGVDADSAGFLFADPSDGRLCRITPEGYLRERVSTWQPPQPGRRFTTGLFTERDRSLWALGWDATAGTVTVDVALAP